MLIAENALYADLYPFRHLLFYDADSYASLRRKKKLAQRGSRISLPDNASPRSLVTRSILSHVRQYEGLPSLLFFALIMAPLGALLLFGEFNLLVTMVWVLLLFTSPRGQRELTIVFREDQQNRMIRDHLPYNTLALLLFDSLPALVFSSLLSSLVLLAMLPIGFDLFFHIGFALFISLAVILCSGLDHVRFSVANWRFSYECSLLSFVLVIFLLSHLVTPATGILGALAMLAIYVFLIIRGVERP
jgi:hypothetical protein